MHDRAPPAGPAFAPPGPDKDHILAHRPEIDGLRSFAILPILLLHCGASWLRGGYIGVDIFFVISGYLITAILLREMAAGSFTLAGFYRRRIVRILPALVAMIAITLAIGCVMLFPVQMRDLARSAAATALFGSNIYFYMTADYFAGSAEVKPLIHTWSLAVEEQFYVLYPALLLALRGASRRRLIAVLAALGAISFAIGGALVIPAQSAGFYLLPSRIWELVIGGLVAVGAYPRLSSRMLREWICWLALIGIVLCCLAIGTGRPFPVPFALPPVAGAAALLAYAPGTSAARFLSWRPLRLVGLISYSLYLWHRPIIAFYLLEHGLALRWTDTLILIAASFTAATLSYALVEKPALARWRKGSGLRPHAVALATLAAIAGIGLALAAGAERLRSLPPEVVEVTSFIGFDSTPAGKEQYQTDRCFVIPTGRGFDPACLTPAPGRRNVLLIGDSHAAQLSQALRRQLAPDHLMQATAAGCRPLIAGGGLRRCRAILEQAFHHTDLSRVSAVIIGGRWLENETPALLDTIRHFRERGVPVLVMGPTVEYEGDFPDLLGRAMLAGDPASPARFRTAERLLLDRRMAPLVRAAGAAYVSHVAAECPGGRCRLREPDGTPVHVDTSHLSVPAAERVARIVLRELPRR